jgi:hypothetical protein
MVDIANIVVPMDSDQVERFAAEELAAYVIKMTDREIKVANKTSGKAIYIGLLPEYVSTSQKEHVLSELDTLKPDGFIIRSMGDDLVIKGRTPRGTLYGVYDYLRMLGIRWYFPGREHEFIPKKGKITLKGIDITESPDMDHRGISIHSSNSALHDWVDFAAKVKLNAIHLHSDELLHEMPDIMASRGLDFGLRRHFFGEVYPPPDEAEMDRNRSLLLEYTRTLPVQLNDFFLWPADKPLELREYKQDGKLSISDAVLMFTNEMLKAIRTLRPTARMSFLAYWSTWEVPKTVKPSNGVFLELAPMFRCFSHAIPDPACPINSKKILPVIEDMLEVFVPAEAHVLGYWLDASLFGRGRYKALSGRLPQMGNIIKQDLRYYKSRGITNISTFAVGVDREYLSKYASPALFHYPALLWDVEFDPRLQLVDFCENYYGDRSIAEAFQVNEQIDPNDTSADGWDTLADGYARAILIVKEILQESADDVHKHRLNKLIRELEHMKNWCVKENQENNC